MTLHMDPAYTQAVWALVIVLICFTLAEIARTIVELKKYYRDQRAYDELDKRFKVAPRKPLPHNDWLASADTLKMHSIPGIPLEDLSIRERAKKMQVIHKLHRILRQP